MGNSTIPKRRKPIRFSTLSDEVRQETNDKVANQFQVKNAEWANLTVASDWGNAIRRLNTLVALGSRPNFMFSIPWENYAAPYLTEAEYDGIFERCEGDRDLVFGAVKQEITRKRPNTARKNIDRIVFSLSGKGGDSAFAIFHLVALNEFVAHNTGDGTTFGQYLDDPATVAAVNDKLANLTLTESANTDLIFGGSYQHSDSNSYGLALWYRGLPSTKQYLMSFTADDYVLLLNSNPYYVLNTRDGGTAKLLKSFKEKLSYDDDSTPVTAFDLESMALAAIMGSDNRSRSDSYQPASSAAAALTAVEWVIGSSNAVNRSGTSRAQGSDARLIRDTLRFLVENAGKLSTDEMISTLAALSEPNAFVRSTETLDSFKLFIKVIKEGTVDQFIGFCRLISHILLTRQGVRPTYAQWLGHLEDPGMLDLDPILSVGLLVEAGEPDKGKITNVSLAEWRSRFHA